MERPSFDLEPEVGEMVIDDSIKDALLEFESIQRLQDHSNELLLDAAREAVGCLRKKSCLEHAENSQSPDSTPSRSPTLSPQVSPRHGAKQTKAMTKSLKRWEEDVSILTPP